MLVCVVLHPKATPFLILKQRPYTGSMSRLGIRVALVIVFYTCSCLNVTSPVFRQWILTQAGEAIPTYCQLRCTTSRVPIGHPLRAASIKACTGVELISPHWNCTTVDTYSPTAYGHFIYSVFLSAAPSAAHCFTTRTVRPAPDSHMQASSLRSHNQIEGIVRFPLGSYLLASR